MSTTHILNFYFIFEIPKEIIDYSELKTVQKGIGKKQIQITKSWKARNEFGERLIVPLLLATVRTYNLIFAIYEDRGRGP